MRPLSPWSRPAPAPSPTSHAIPASAPAHPRSVSPKPTSIGSPPPTDLHALSGQQPGAELAKQSVVEAGIGQVQGQQILPVDPSSDRLSGLAGAQAPSELQERDQGEAPGRVPGLTAPRVKISKAGIVEHGAEAVTQQEVGVAAGERG